MKKLIFTTVLCFSLFGTLTAQNIWKNIDISNFESCEILGVGTNGSIFIESTFGIVYRSQNDGLTWDSIINTNEGLIFDAYDFYISSTNRIHIYDYASKRIFYSDDDGNSWQQTPPTPINTIWVRGIYSPSNDTLLVWDSNQIFWSIDEGDTWDFTTFDFVNEEIGYISCAIVNDTGDVYTSVYGLNGENAGIYHSTLSNMQNWTLAAFEGYSIPSMTFDPEGNVIANSFGEGSAGYIHEPGFYLFTTRELAVSDNGIIYKLKSEPDSQMRLNYTIDHGDQFYYIGETMPVTHIPYPGSDDAKLFKGNDNHLYYWGGGVFYKSIKNANDIPRTSGIVTRVPAPYFENNAFDTRMAIVSEEDTCYVTIDDFWTNPAIDAIVVQYDTIPEGAPIVVFGNVYEKVDELGRTFKVVDIQEITDHYYDIIVGAVWFNESPVYITNLKSHDETYVVTIGGEPQTYPLVFHGMNLSNRRCYFIGHISEQIDLNGEPYMAMELQEAIPFDNAFQCEGYLTINNNDSHYLTCVSDGTPYYLTRNWKVYRNNYLNNDVFGETFMASIKGVLFDRYDIYGAEVKTVEVVEMSTENESTLDGTVGWTPIPPGGPVPVPGLTMALIHEGSKYCIANEQDDNGTAFFLVGNDTIYEEQEITATFTTEMRTNSYYGFYYYINITQAEVLHDYFLPNTEWYYEIHGDDGTTIGYQHLKYIGDTIFSNYNLQAKVILRTNHFNDGSQPEVTHEYIIEDNERAQIYWYPSRWNLFTLLYNFSADVGDEWSVMGNNENLIVHVDSVEMVEYDGKTYRMLHVSDQTGSFNGDILCGVGHLTSFFPEKEMVKDGFEVDGLRCYWQNDELILHIGDEDCDAIHSVINMVDDIETDDFQIYPNPTNGVIVVETCHGASLQDQTEYRITNLLGQTLLTGRIDGEKQQIDVSALPDGIYFINVGEISRKIVVL